MNAAAELREAADDYLFLGSAYDTAHPSVLIRQVSPIAPKFGGLYFDDQGVANGLN